MGAQMTNSEQPAMKNEMGGQRTATWAEYRDARGEPRKGEDDCYRWPQCRMPIASVPNLVACISVKPRTNLYLVAVFGARWRRLVPFLWHHGVRSKSAGPGVVEFYIKPDTSKRAVCRKIGTK